MEFGFGHGSPDTSATDAWTGLVKGRKHITLPETLKIGTGFVNEPTKTPLNVYSELCDLMRMEMVTLMERIHCLYVEAYSRRDCRTAWYDFGLPRKQYKIAVAESDAIDRIHERHFRNGVWPGAVLLQDLETYVRPVREYIMVRGQPFF